MPTSNISPKLCVGVTLKINEDARTLFEYWGNKNKNVDQWQNVTTPAGLEPALPKGNRFLIYRRNHLAMVS
jgi:hypothetical protein